MNNADGSDNSRLATRVPTIEAEDDVSNLTPCSPSLASMQTTRTGPVVLPDSRGDRKPQQPCADIYPDPMGHWASMSSVLTAQSLTVGAPAIPQVISRSASTSASNQQNSFVSTLAFPAWHDPLSMSHISTSSGTTSVPLAAMLPNAPPVAGQQQRAAAVTVFDSTDFMPQTGDLPRRDSEGAPSSSEKGTASPHDKRPRITFATMVTSSVVTNAGGVVNQTSQQELPSPLVPSPLPSPASERASFAFPLGARPKGASSHTSAQSLSGDAPHYFQPVSASTHGSTTGSGSTNLKSDLERWFSSTHTHPAGARLGNSAVAASRSTSSSHGPSPRHGSTRLPQTRAVSPTTDSKPTTLSRRHSVQAPIGVDMPDGISPNDLLLFGALKGTQIGTQRSPSPTPSASQSTTTGSASLSLPPSNPAPSTGNNGRSPTFQRKPSFESRTPNGGSLRSIHEAVMEEQQMSTLAIQEQSTSPPHSQRRPSLSLYTTAQRPPTATTLRSVIIEPTSATAPTPVPSMRVMHPPAVTSNQMVVNVLASAHHIGPTTSRQLKDGNDNRDNIEHGSDQVDDPAAHSPWCPPFLRRLFRAIYSLIWLPVYERLAPIWRLAFSNPNSRLWLMLDILVSLADLFYMIVIPITFAFVCDTPKGLANIQVSVDIVMMFALVVDYHRPRRDKYGQLITDPVQRKRYYWQSASNRRKVLSCIPFDWVMHGLQNMYYPGLQNCVNPISVYEFSDGTMSLADSSAIGSRLVQVHSRYSYLHRDIHPYAVAFSSIRLIRLLHVSDTVLWIRNMRVVGLNRALSRLAKNLLAAAYISLWNAVLFWFLSSHLDSPKRYIVNYMFDPDTGIPTSFSERLTWAYVDGQKALFFILREVKLVQESAYQAVEMMLGAIVYGSIFGNLVSIVKSLDDQAEFDKTIKQRNFKKAYLRQYLIENQFPQSLQQRILDQEELDFALKKGMDMDAIFNTFPRTMKQEILVHLYWDLISKVPLFSKTSDVFKLALLERITTVSVQAGFYIFKAGDAGTDLFFIKRGSVQILTGDESKVIVTLQSGSFFGEIALMEDCQRTATAKTGTEAQLCALSKPDFLEIMRTYPAMAELVHQHIVEKKEADARRKADEEKAKMEAAAKAALEAHHHKSQHSGLLSGMIYRGRNGTLSRHATLLRGGSGSKAPSLAGTLKLGTIKRTLMSRKDAVVGSIRSLASNHVPGVGGSHRIGGDDLKNLEASRHVLVSGGDLQQMFTANRPSSQDAAGAVEEKKS